LVAKGFLEWRKGNVTVPPTHPPHTYTHKEGGERERERERKRERERDRERERERKSVFLA